MRIGQANIMEYVLLIFFIFMILIIIMLFISGWQISSSESNKYELVLKRAMFLTKSFSISPYINREGFKEGSMFEDSKLMVLKCEDLEKIFGKGWFATVSVLGSTMKCEKDSDYPECGVWEYCKTGKNSISYEVPVNIYRKISDRTDIGVLEVGIYV